MFHNDNAHFCINIDRNTYAMREKFNIGIVFIYISSSYIAINITFSECLLEYTSLLKKLYATYL